MKGFHIKKVIFTNAFSYHVMKDDKVVVYKTFMRPFEAYLIKGLLDASGIECFLSNEIFASRNPAYSSGVEAMKLNVFEKDVPKINALLNTENNNLEAGRHTLG